MCQEIRDRYGAKAQVFVYPDPASRQRKTSAGGRTDLSILQNAGFNVKAKLKHTAIRDRVNVVNACLKASFVCSFQIFYLCILSKFKI